MDYRKPAVFGENWSSSRYKVLPYFTAEKALLSQSGLARILEIGCANGWNMSRFAQLGREVFGLDMVRERVELAHAHGPVLIASGLNIPISSESLDVVYIQHVLHHIGDVKLALSESWRVLRPGGVLFLVETVEDSPIIHWGRRLHPSWLGDEINASFDFSALTTQIEQAGFCVTEAQQYSVLFWIWEIVPDQLPTMERLTPLLVALEKLLIPVLRRYGAHCYLVAVKPENE